VQPIRTRQVLRTAFLYRPTENHDIAETEFLVDAGGYLTVIVRHELSGHLDYEDRNHIEKWFQMITIWINRFHPVLAEQSIKCKTPAVAVQTLL